MPLDGSSCVRKGNFKKTTASLQSSLYQFGGTAQLNAFYPLFLGGDLFSKDLQ